MNDNTQEACEGPGSDERLVVAVSGGRPSDQHVLYEVLDSYEAVAQRTRRRMVVVQSGWLGADGMAREWARLNGIECISEQAHFGLEGRAGGVRRNRMIIDHHRPEACIAVSGGRGIADLVARCLMARIPVLWLEGPTSGRG